MQTFPYRVKPGARLPHLGEVLEAGTVVQLPRAVGAEVRHLVDALDADGQEMPMPTPEAIALEERPAHERAGLLQRRRAELVAHLVDLQEIAARAQAAAEAAAGEVASLEQAIDGIDVQLAAAAQGAPLVDVPPVDAPPPIPARKLADPEPETTSPANPAQQE